MAKKQVWFDFREAGRKRHEMKLERDRESLNRKGNKLVKLNRIPSYYLKALLRLMITNLW